MLFVQLYLISYCANNKLENWKIIVRGAIFSTPIIQGNTMYVGTEEGFFYWIDANSGKIIHEVKVSGPIRSNALVLGDNVFVESNGQLYCFSASTAQENYKISPNGENVDMVDPWDYFHSSPVEHQGAIYYAGNKGIIYIVDPGKGAIAKMIKTPEEAPIRSALTFDGDNLYFGDNNGVVYEYNLTKESFTLTYKTFTKRSYSTYGFITGGPFVCNEKLIFSNRHETFTAVDLKTKAVAWSRVDEKGSWWPAVPVIIGDKVIIGGSDNYILSALSLDSGKTIWDYKVDYNIFCKPLVTNNNTLIVGTGDSYMNRKGNGSVFSINAETGNLINKFKPGGNIFSSPVKHGNNVIICTTTGNICSMSEEFFTNPQTSKVSIEGDIDLSFFNDSTAIIEKQLLVNNHGNKAIQLNYSVKTDGNFPDSLLKVKGEKNWVYTKGTNSVYLEFNRGSLKPGLYKGEITFTINDRAEAIVKHFSIDVQGSGKLNEQAFEISEFKADSKDCSVKFQLKVNRRSLITANLRSAQSDTIVGYIAQINPKWGVYRMDTDIYFPSKVKPGKYRIVFESKEQKVTYEFIKE